MTSTVQGELQEAYLQLLHAKHPGKYKIGAVVSAREN